MLADHTSGWGSILDGRQGFWVSQAPWVRSCHPSVCCCWPPLLPSRSEVFCFPLNSVRTLALSAQSHSVFFAYRQSELIWGTARRPGSANWKGDGGPGWCWPGRLWLELYRAQVALEAQHCLSRNRSAHSASGCSLAPVAPCQPCSIQFTLTVLSSVRHLGTNRFHSLPQSLVSAAVLAHGPPACVQCFSSNV